MNIEIKIPIPEDAEGMQILLKETWLATYPDAEAGVTPGDIEYMFRDYLSAETLQKRRTALADPPKGNYLQLIAKDGAKVVGSCSVTKLNEFDKLGTIYVLPECQRKGIGMQLWKAVYPFFSPGKDIIVQVATYNLKAIAFYTKLGFVDNGKRFTDERFRMKSGAVLPEMEMILSASQRDT